MARHSIPLPRTLILDYYDSYTNNLLTLFTQIYSDAEVLEKVVVIKADRFTWDEFVSQILPSIDCVILSPGPGRPDNPPDIGFALNLLRELAAGPRSLPVLGVCLGHQAIGVAFGAKIINTPKITHGHVVEVTPLDSTFGPFASPIWNETSAKATFDVVVYNSLTVDPTTVPGDLEVIAIAGDKEGAGETVQGLAHKGDGKLIWGVQFHPESIASTRGRTLLQSYIAAVHQRYQRPSSYPSLPVTLTGACSFRAPESATAPPSPTLQPVSRIASGKAALVEERFGSVGKDVLTQDAFERVIRQQRKGKGKDAHGIGEVWLDGESPNFPTTTSLTIPSFLLTYSLATRSVSLHRPDRPVSSLALRGEETFWEWLATGQRRLERAITDRTTRGEGSQSGWRGGWVGWFAYEMKEESLAGYRRQPRPEGTAEVDACWAYSREILERSASGQWIARGVVSDSNVIGELQPRNRTESEDMLSWFHRLDVRLASSVQQFDDFISIIKSALDNSTSHLPREAPLPAIPEFHPRDNGPDYMSRIDQCRDAIRRGESYELTMTTMFSTSNPSPEDNYPLYLKLRALNPSYYSSYLSFPCIEYTVCSSSPERFMRINKDREVDMKPIKGTRARVKVGQCVCTVDASHVRGSEACVTRAREEDRKRAEELQANEKERAENLMIVDLIRADLLSCCVPSTVAVPKLIAVESYESVHNLVTTVSGQLMETVGAIEAIQRCFPPGSMTGAPKLRSVQLLDDLESRHHRGIYSGALGYLSLDGSADVAVVIRTIVCRPEGLTIGAGGAITWLSDRDSEWDEVLVKVKSVTGRRFA